MRCAHLRLSFTRLVTFQNYFQPKDNISPFLGRRRHSRRWSSWSLPTFEKDKLYFSFSIYHPQESSQFCLMFPQYFEVWNKTKLLYQINTFEILIISPESVNDRSKRRWSNLLFWHISQRWEDQHLAMIMIMIIMLDVDDHHRNHKVMVMLKLL